MKNMSRSEVAGKANKELGETPVWNNLGKKIHLIHSSFFFLRIVFILTFDFIP
jgi:hypothetical protein